MASSYWTFVCFMSARLYPSAISCISPAGLCPGSSMMLGYGTTSSFYGCYFSICSSSSAIPMSADCNAFKSFTPSPTYIALASSDCMLWMMIDFCIGVARANIFAFCISGLRFALVSIMSRQSLDPVKHIVAGFLRISSIVDVTVVLSLTVQYVTFCSSIVWIITISCLLSKIPHYCADIATLITWSPLITLIS